MDFQADVFTAGAGANEISAVDEGCVELDGVAGLGLDAALVGGDYYMD